MIGRKERIDSNDILREIAIKHGVSLSTAVDIVRFQYKVLRDELIRNKEDFDKNGNKVIQIFRFGKFRVRKYKRKDEIIQAGE